MEDRFGQLPQEIINLFDVVKVRNLAASLGFEKVIIKNGLFIAFFIENTMSPYYKSPVFERVLQKSAEESTGVTLKQSDSRLKIVARNVNSISAALQILKKLR